MDDPLILPTVSATRNRLADLMTSIGQGAGKAVDWLAGGAHVGAEPTLALMRGVDPATQAAQAAWIQEHLARGGM